jgi:adenylosuccinate synthase
MSKLGTTRLVVVVGGQFGSEGKGAAAARLAQDLTAPVVVRTGGPNAGHTVVAESGITYKLRQLPTAAVSNPDSILALAPGSIVDLEVLEQEMSATGRSVWVDRSATILEPKHAKAEQDDPDMQWGSTRKGIGAARADRIHRTALTWGTSFRRVGEPMAVSADVPELLRQELYIGRSVLVEAAQGYGLGLNTRFYPKTTSANCRAIDALADCGLSPWEFGIRPEVWLVVRPYPIRVAGDSGPLLNETTWEALGLPQERTTVTDKVRRVGMWDERLVREAVSANGGDGVKVWFSMADQVIPAVSGMTEFQQLARLSNDDINELQNWMNLIAECGARVHAIGTGPNTAIVLSDSHSQGWWSDTRSISR